MIIVRSLTLVKSIYIANTHKNQQMYFQVIRMEWMMTWIGGWINWMMDDDLNWWLDQMDEG